MSSTLRPHESAKRGEKPPISPLCATKTMRSSPVQLFTSPFSRVMGHRVSRCSPLRVVWERLGVGRHYAYAHARALWSLLHHDVHSAAVQPLAHRPGNAQDLLAPVLDDLVVAFAVSRREAERHFSAHLVIGHGIQ